MKDLILVCGSGGVGKTTLSAGIALCHALQGKKTIVLTVDPARRLATSLGLENLGAKASRIREDIPLYAMMLDTKRTFDQLVEKYAPSKETEQKILKNKLYQQMSDMIAGSQEYMAMEKLYEIVQSQTYEVVVIDTPPTTHAIDFLEAPDRMVNALSNSMVHLLLKPTLKVGKSGLKLLERGSQLVLKVFDRITGFAFLQDISELLVAFRTLLGGFQNRAAEVKKILERPSTSFVLVASCEKHSSEEAAIFQEKLQRLGFHLEGIIFNRVHPNYSLKKSEKVLALEDLEDRFGKRLSQKMQDAFKKFQLRAGEDQRLIKEFETKLTPDQYVTQIPLFEKDIHDIDGLMRLQSYLIPSAGISSH